MSGNLQQVLQDFRDVYTVLGDARFWIYVVPGEHLRASDSLQSIGYASFAEAESDGSPASWHFAVEESRREIAEAFLVAAAEAASQFDRCIREVVEPTTPCGATAQWLTLVLLQDPGRLEPVIDIDGESTRIVGWCWTNPFSASIATVEKWLQGSLSLATAALPPRRLRAEVGMSGVLSTRRRFATADRTSIRVPLAMVHGKSTARRRDGYAWRKDTEVPAGFEWYIEGTMQELAEVICWNSKASTKRNRQFQTKLANAQDLIGVQISGQRYRVHFNSESRHREAVGRLEQVRTTPKSTRKGTRNE